jgi:hypothetical protein
MTFNNIMDKKQRVMGLLLDGSGEDDASKFLLVTKALLVPSAHILNPMLLLCMTNSPHSTSSLRIPLFRLSRYLVAGREPQQRS